MIFVFVYFNGVVYILRYNKKLIIHKRNNNIICGLHFKKVHQSTQIEETTSKSIFDSKNNVAGTTNNIN